VIALTPALLRAAAGCTQDAADLYADPLSQACAFYGINTPQRLAAFLAQLAHESGSFRHTREVWGPTLAQDRYEGRRDLGNVYPGDGKLFAGHGLLQITGRANHAAVRDRLREAFGADVPDFERDPEALMLPRWACLSAADWWAHHGCNDLADDGNYIGIGRLINRGNARAVSPANGEADRLQRWERAKAALAVSEAAPAAPERPTAADPQPAAPIATPTQKGGFMAPILAGIGKAIFTSGLPAIIAAIPRLGTIFGGGSEVAQRNVKAVEVVAETIAQAVGATNAQQVVEAMDDPAMVQQARQAVDANWSAIHQAHEASLSAARTFVASAPQRVVFMNLLFHELLALLFVVTSGAGGIAALFFSDLSAELKGAIVTLMLIGGWTGVKEFYFGGSRGSDRKTELMSQGPAS